MPTGRFATITLLALFASTLGFGPAVAQDNKHLVYAGRVVAEAWCMRCHVIGTENQPSALVGTPSFISLAERGISEGELSFALLNPHPVMPKFELSRDTVRALSAYINSLGE